MKSGCYTRSTVDLVPSCDVVSAVMSSVSYQSVKNIIHVTYCSLERVTSSYCGSGSLTQVQHEHDCITGWSLRPGNNEIPWYGHKNGNRPICRSVRTEDFALGMFKHRSPFSPYFSSLPFPSTPSLLVLPPSLSLSLIQLGGLGESCKLPSGSGHCRARLLNAFW